MALKAEAQSSRWCSSIHEHNCNGNGCESNSPKAPMFGWKRGVVYIQRGMLSVCPSPALPKIGPSSPWAVEDTSSRVLTFSARCHSYKSSLSAPDCRLIQNKQNC